MIGYFDFSIWVILFIFNLFLKLFNHFNVLTLIMSIYILFIIMILTSEKNDGRHLRSIKTQKLIVDSTIILFLKSNSAKWPTAEQVAKHSNIGLRTVFRHFDDMESLIESCHEKFMITIEDYFQNKKVISKKLKNRITFVINERVKIYDDYQNVFVSTIKKIQKFKSARKGLIEGNIRLKQRFETIVPEILELSKLDQAYIDTSISFTSWLRLSTFYKFSNEVIVNKFILQTEKLLSAKE